MAYIPIEKLTKKNNSLFRLVLAAAQRANEINTGIPALVSVASKSPTTIALTEFSEGKVYYEEVAAPVKVEKAEEPKE